jgi:hypothetical protein
VPRRCTVCDHPEFEAIDKALVAGEASFRNIAERFSVSVAALHRHKADHLPETLLQAQAAREQESALDVMAELERCFKRVNLLFDACDRWLRDPADPSRYNIGPRAEELMVTYTEAAVSEGSKPRQRKASLAELLERIEQEGRPGRAVTMVETKHADPRELVLKTAGRLQPQIELLAKLLGELDVRPVTNVLVSAEWVMVRTAMMETLSPYPQARVAVAERLSELEGR